ncbi:FxLD family lanthipeptide [Streptomyces sp. F63]|uniref:FxLD family lanthipeptide n=1 Tax=Streptomyces sp. F63 TaxID=2824887 RepID=UPI001B37DF51|nr:FxLD family lanthipeptide [Streptomyces sp. F63]MBQ0983726.1 FxLD family lanthipeptide [Streptomyces sp. F63]
MTTTALLDPATALDEPPTNDLLDDEFALDVHIVIAEHPTGKFSCATSDGCGNTCANGASACNSFTDDPA